MPGFFRIPANSSCGSLSGGTVRAVASRAYQPASVAGRGAACPCTATGRNQPPGFVLPESPEETCLRLLQASCPSRTYTNPPPESVIEPLEAQFSAHSSLCGECLQRR